MINTTHTQTNHDDDIVTINAGGRSFQILRSTLCLPPDDTAFVKLFCESSSSSIAPLTTSPHNTVVDKKDASGNVFLDHDPELIEIILNFLRMKKIEDPFDPIVEPPCVPSPKTKDFKRLLNHFGLTAFFYYPSTLPVATVTATAPMVMVMTTANLVSDSNVRKMSFDSRDMTAETSSTSSSKNYSPQESFASIVEGFDYCYG